MRGLRARRAAHSEHPFMMRTLVLQNHGDAELFTYFFHAGAMAPLGIVGVADDSTRLEFWLDFRIGILD
ncbi:MAG: hypothetical protein WB677_05430 [Xanthobacteraceae bacterium]